MIEEWNKLTDKITQEWIRKYFKIPEDEELSYYWIANQIGTVFEFADYWFDFQNVLDCYKYDISRENLFDWYDACLSDSSFSLSLKNFILKPEELKEQQRLRVHRANQALKIAEKEFKEAMQKYTDEK